MRIKQPKNRITDGFIGVSKMERVQIILRKGYDNTRDLVRLSGVSFSNFIRLDHEGVSERAFDLIKGVGAGVDEFHFVELLAKCIDLGLIHGTVSFNSGEDFVKSLTNQYAPNANIGLLDYEPDVNTDPGHIVISPAVGGYVGKDYSLDMAKGLNDFSVKQLDILYSGISELNPVYPLLDKIETIIKNKIGK